MNFPRTEITDTNEIILNAIQQTTENTVNTSAQEVNENLLLNVNTRNNEYSSNNNMNLNINENADTYVDGNVQEINTHILSDVSIRDNECSNYIDTNENHENFATHNNEQFNEHIYNSGYHANVLNNDVNMHTINNLVENWNNIDKANHIIPVVAKEQFTNDVITHWLDPEDLPTGMPQSRKRKSSEGQHPSKQHSIATTLANTTNIHRHFTYQHIGLHNPNTMCFINALFQAFFVLKFSEFYHRFQRSNDHSTCECIGCVLFDTFTQYRRSKMPFTPYALHNWTTSHF